MDRARIDAWLAEWSETWGIPRLASHVEIEIGRRLRTSLGRCHTHTGKIQIHPALLREPEPILREVVCHEAAHVAVGLLHGRRVRPHGREWATLMHTAGYAPRARMDIRTLSHDFQRAVAPRVLYDHRCKVCGTARTARRRMPAWRCRSCWIGGLVGKLEIIRRDADAI